VHVSVDRLPASGRRVLSVVVEMAGPRCPVWLVGGALREMVSDRAARDLDLTVAGGALGLGLLVPFLFYRLRKPSWKQTDQQEVSAS